MVRARKIYARLCAIMLIVCLAFSMSSFTRVTNEASVSTAEHLNETRSKTYLSVMGISNTNTRAYSSVPITRNGASLNLNSLIINGTYYIPLRNFINYTTNMSVSYSNVTKTITVSGGGLYLTASDGSYVVYANDRALFELTPARLMSDGKIYIPAKTVAKALGLRLSATSSSLEFSGTVSPLTSASRYYDTDSVLWLSRIISAESRGEPLIGQIAVGNIIMNRVKSPIFPNTIWGVIFDRKYGVQFSPVANGTIYNTPVYTATLAAKICLEGFSLSDDILYFLNPRHSTSSWITSNRPYLFTVQNHEFYG